MILGPLIDLKFLDEIAATDSGTSNRRHQQLDRMPKPQHNRPMARPTVRKDVTGRERRKLIAFDEETWHALNLLARDSTSSLQELADEAFRDLLRKHNRPVDLKTALRESVRERSEESKDGGGKLK
jgi:hypothetical protein